jgi:hypothetical protein
MNNDQSLSSADVHGHDHMRESVVADRAQDARL